MQDHEHIQPFEKVEQSDEGSEKDKADQSTNNNKVEEHFTAGNETPEIATNDGSVIETLDTAFHGTPGWSEGENLSGSNRADYYEARSNGKSDSEEELDEIRKTNKPPSS